LATLKSLLICANGDNEITLSERDWVVGYAAAYGAPEQLVEALKNYQGDEGIDSAVVKQIEEICAEESKLREKRLKLMYPTGAPL
jgi:hypothetical protein